MSWQDNRRRKRVWYRHYRQLAEELSGLMQRSAMTGQPIAAEAILKMFYDLYERRRLHRRNSSAKSAYESLLLACTDTDVKRWLLRVEDYPGARDRPTGMGDLFKKTPEPATVPGAYVLGKVEKVEMVTFGNISFGVDKPSSGPLGL